MVTAGLGAHVWAYGFKGFPIYIKQLFQSWRIAENAQRSLENFILFPRWAKSKFKISGPPIKLTGFDEIVINVNKKVKLHANYLPAENGNPTLVFAYGNGMSMEDTNSLMIAAAKKKNGCLVFDYRGYGESTGFPSEAGIYEDFQAASHYLSHTLEADKRVPLFNQIAIGESIGGSAVINAAHQAELNGTPYKGLIVCSSFTNMQAIAQDKKAKGEFPLTWIPKSILEAVQPFDSLTKISAIQKTPTVIAHGDADSLIPHQMGQALYDGVKTSSKDYWLIPNKHHCQLMQETDCIETLLSKLEALNLNNKAA